MWSYFWWLLYYNYRGNDSSQAEWDIKLMMTYNCTKPYDSYMMKKVSLRKALERFNIPLGTLNNKVSDKHKKSLGHPIVFRCWKNCNFAAYQIACKLEFPHRHSRILARDLFRSQNRTVKQCANNLPNYDRAMYFINQHNVDIPVKILNDQAQSVRSFFENLSATIHGADVDDVVTPDRIYNYDEIKLSNLLILEVCLTYQS